MTAMASLKGLTAVLTGASSGIGPYIARALAAERMNIVLAARTTEKLEALAAELRGSGVGAEVATTDVTEPADRRNLAKRARTAFGQIDVLINNAGYEEIIEFHKQNPEAIEKTIETNLIAPMLLTREILPNMIERGSGHVIHIASLAGRLGMPFGAVYSGSKGGLAEFSLSLHGELEGTGVTSSVICPGFIAEAGMFARKDRKAPPTLKEARPSDVAKAVITALKTNTPEIMVTARPVRPLMALRAISPKAMNALANKLGLIGFLRSVATRKPEN